jgi:hypothetical protein
LRTISHQLENLNKAIPELQAKVSKAEIDISSLSNVQSSLVNRMSAKPDPFATANAIQNHPGSSKIGRSLPKIQNIPPKAAATKRELIPVSQVFYYLCGVFS